MTPSQQQNDTLSIFQSNNKSFKEDQANHGFGAKGAWPLTQSGEVRAEILAYEAVRDDGAFSWKGGGGGTRTCLRCFPRYRTVTADGAELVWEGEDRLIAADPDTLPEDSTSGKQRTRARIAREWVKGDFEALLGPTMPEDYGQCFTLVNQMIADAQAANAGIFANVKIVIRPGKPYTDKDGQQRDGRAERRDHIQALLASD